MAARSAAVATGTSGSSTIIAACSSADDREVAPADPGERRRAQARRRAVNHLRQLGFAVALAPKDASA